MDEQRLKESFACVAAYGDEVPLFFYSHLFLGHPELREKFPVSMAGQRDKLLNAPGRIVSEVSNRDALVPFLQGLGRDQRKFGTVADHYPAVGASFLATLAHFSGTAWDEELARDWTAAYTVIAEVMNGAAADDQALNPPWWDATVVGHERRTMDVAVLRVAPRDPDFRGETGTVADVIGRRMPLTGHDAYICGSSAMVRATVERLRSLGMPQDHIYFEDFGWSET